MPGKLINGSDGVPIRVVTDPNATAVRAIDYDVTHPYRQMDLLKRVKDLLPGATITTHDLQAVRHSFNILKRDEYHHKSMFGSGQYSESYAQWIVKSYLEDTGFFIKARAKYSADRRG
jgi:hypothetical protein